MAEFKIGQNTVKNKKKKPFSIGQNTKKSKKSKDKKEVGRNTVKGRSIGAAIMTILSAPAGFKIGQNTKKELRKSMSPGPKKKIAKRKIDRETAPFKRKEKNIEANKQVRSIKESKAANREAGRGKVMPKRTNVLRDKKGKMVKSKKGNPIKTGKGTAAYKRMMEKRGNK